MEHPKRDWNKIVEDNKGTMFFAPEAVLSAAKEWQAERIKFNDEVNRVAKIEAGIGILFTQLIQAIRLHMEENGFENIWTCDVGFNPEALKEGLYIINITKGERNA